MPNITIFPNTTDATNGVVEDSAKVVEMIRTGRWKSKVSQLNLLPRDSKEQELLKKTLHAITWQGVFSYRNDNSMVEHSGLVSCDFDHIPADKWDFYWQTLSGFPYTYCLFRSPRREGMKAIIRIPAEPENHKKYLAGLKHVFRDSPFYDHYDDKSRLCYASYDPDLYFNPDAVPFIHKKETYIVDQTYQNGSDVPTTPVQIRQCFDNQVNWLNQSQGSFYQDGNKHIFLFRLFCACNRSGIPRNDAINLAWSLASQIESAKPVPRDNFDNIATDSYKRYSSQFGLFPFHKTSDTETTIKVAKPGAFPVQVFPQGIQDLINELNKCLNFSKDFLSTSIMWTLATINGNKYKLRVKNGWLAPTLFWFCNVGESGVIKTHPMEAIIDSIRRIDRQTKLEYDHVLEQWEIDNDSCIRNKQKNPNKRPRFNQIVVGDFTIESLHVIHTINTRGIGLYKDELKGFFNDMNKYRKGSDEQFWLESFNNKGYIVNRVSKEPMMINDTMINILGAIQPEVLMSIIREYSGNGLINRFLFTTNETEVFPLSRDNMERDLMDQWNQSIKVFHDFINYTESVDTTILEMDSDAFDLLLAIDIEFCAIQRSEDETANMKNYVSKMKTYLPRLAMLMWLFDLNYTGCDMVVNRDQMARAKMICDYFIASARFVFDSADRKLEIDSVAQCMKSATKVEKIIFLHSKKFISAEIARQVNSPSSYVSIILKKNNLTPNKG